MSEIVQPLPDVNQIDALFETIQQTIINGDFPEVDDFLNSFTGLFEQDGTLHFQIGGLESPSRRYAATAIVRDIPGIEILAEDASEWWTNRSDATRHTWVQYAAGAMGQELYTEQLQFGLE